MEKFEQQAVLSQPYSYSSNAQPCRRKSAGGWEHGPPLDKRTDKPCYAPTVHVHDPLANGHDAIKIIPGGAGAALDQDPPRHRGVALYEAAASSPIISSLQQFCPLGSYIPSSSLDSSLAHSRHRRGEFLRRVDPA